MHKSRRIAMRVDAIALQETVQPAVCIALLVQRERHLSLAEPREVVFQDIPEETEIPVLELASQCQCLLRADELHEAVVAKEQPLLDNLYGVVVGAHVVPCLVLFGLAEDVDERRLIVTYPVTTGGKGVAHVVQRPFVIDIHHP